MPAIRKENCPSARGTVDGQQYRAPHINQSATFSVSCMGCPGFILMRKDKSGRIVMANGNTYCERMDRDKSGAN